MQESKYIFYMVGLCRKTVQGYVQKKKQKKTKSVQKFMLAYHSFKLLLGKLDIAFIAQPGQH